MTDYTQLFAAIDRELAGRKARGEPLRVNLWDGNHASPIPRDIATHPGLLNVVKRYGTPVYVVEDASAGEKIQNAFDRHRVASRRERKIIENEILGTLGRGGLYEKLLKASAQGVQVLFPDVRVAAFKEAAFTQEEGAMYKRFLESVVPAGMECMSITSDKFTKSLSDAEHQVFDSMMEKFAGVVQFGSAEIDEAIAKRVQTALPGNGQFGKAIPIMLYGKAHFGKGRDLNEHLPGVDVAIERNPHSSAATGVQTGISYDVPKMVWYSDQRRLVKLDSDASKRQYLGVREGEALPSKEANAHSPVTPSLPRIEDMPPDLLSKCEAAAAPLKPYVPPVKQGAPPAADPLVLPRDNGQAPKRGVVL